MENKKRYFKLIAGFFGIIAGIFILSNVALWGWQKYALRQGQKAVQEFVNSLKNLEEENYQQVMADTYGGKTPQETLQMYIDAVKKGDFKLASKYFVIDKQKKWEEELLDIKNSNKLNTFLKPLIESNNIEVQYSASKETASIYGPILISFIKYPNGIWKIIEI